MNQELAIKVTGTQPFMGMEIPVVLGGFGPEARCICDKTAAEIHGMEPKNIRARISDNIKRFAKDIDYLDMKIVACQASNNSGGINNLLAAIGYTKMEISKAEHIYILSERGYFKLVKILNSDQAWDVYENLLGEYFALREERKQQKAVGGEKTQPRPSLPAVTAAMKLQAGVAQAAGMDPAYIQIAMAKAFEPYGCDIPANCLPEAEQLYECEEIARELGVMSEKGLPHNKAIAMLIKMIGVDENEKKVLPFSTNAYSNVTVKYKRSVLEKVRHWLEEHNYPSSFRGLDGKNQHLYYKRGA